MNAVTMTQNPEMNGIELRFNARPSDPVLAALKSGGFRWSSRKKLWYARRNDQTMELANAIAMGGGFSFEPTKNTNKCENDLWGLTRTEGIGSHYDPDLSPKQIAALVRAHVKPRFPMCQISVKSDIRSVDICVKASPFDKHSDELTAIREYIQAFAQSFQKVDSNPYRDYYSSNFYGGWCELYYDYHQTEMTVAAQSMREDFQAKKAAFEQAEAQRRHEEYLEYQRQQEEQSRKAEALRKVREANRRMIEASAHVVDGVDYFVNHLLDPAMSKLDSVEEYYSYMDEHPDYARETRARISREVHMSPEHYRLFRGMLLSDWAFIAATGGSETQDERVNSVNDWRKMPKAERDTVEWYPCNAVLIFSEDAPVMVVDAQGFDYCRYVYFFTGKTEIDKRKVEP